MGLAASQARFLAITARKADCEFRSMQIAQNKLSVTRDMAKVSDDYQRSLNATKLVWDYDCDEGVACYAATNLSYSTLMMPSEANNFTPYLLTSRTGSIVLNGALANAAEAVCPGGKPALRTKAGFNKFVNALAATGVISTDTAKEINDAKYNVYKDKEGKSFVFSGTPSKEDIKKYGLGQSPVAQGYDDNAGFGSTPIAKNEYLSYNKYSLAKKNSQEKVLSSGVTGNKTVNAGNKILLINGAQESNADNLTFDKLLNDNVVYISVGEDIKSSLTDIFVNICNAVFDKNYNKTKLFPSGTTIDVSSTGSTEKRDIINERAMKQAWNKMIFDTGVNDSNINHTATESLGIVQSTSNISGGFECSGQTSYAVSLSNMVACLLTYCDVMADYAHTDYHVDASYDISASLLVTEDPEYEYIFLAPNATTQTNLLYSDFYMEMYNNICTYGWITAEDNIDQDQYLEQLIRNGTYFISSYGEDGYFYQTRYNDVDCVVEVVDEDAIARAEAEFTSEKAKLTYQEDRLDLEMKNIETEISSLTTELDSVKNLISKSVEKTFAMFQ